MNETPSVASRFVFEVDDVEIGTFREVEGLAVDVEVVEVREGGLNQYVHQLPGVMRWPHLILRRGMTTGDLFGWLERSSGTGLDGNGKKLTRTSAAVTMLDRDGARIRSFELVDAFAVRWQGPSCDAGSPAEADEELEVAHHGFRIQA
jgi:phage tail-like protein